MKRPTFIDQGKDSMKTVMKDKEGVKTEGIFLVCRESSSKLIVDLTFVVPHGFIHGNEIEVVILRKKHIDHHVISMSVNGCI